MTRSQFAKLRAGDLVVFNGKRLRTVQEGPADKPRRCRCTNSTCSHLWVEFSILRRSWRNRANTVYSWNDEAARGLKLAGRARGLILKSELLALQQAGFDVRKELGRELAEAKRVADLHGRPLCRAFSRLARMAT